MATMEFFRPERCVGYTIKCARDWSPWQQQCEWKNVCLWDFVLKAYWVILEENFWELNIFLFFTFKKKYIVKIRAFIYPNIFEKVTFWNISVGKRVIDLLTTPLAAFLKKLKECRCFKCIYFKLKYLFQGAVPPNVKITTELFKLSDVSEHKSTTRIMY